MNRADAFAHDMLSVLSGKLGLRWECGKAESGQHERVDVLGKKDGKVHVMVEVELRTTAPLVNVAKVWKQVNQRRKGLSNNLILFQAFSAFYTEEGPLRANAEFIGKQMQEACGVRYRSLPMDYRPAKRHAGKPVMRGGGRRTYHAHKLAHRVLNRAARLMG